MNSVLQNAQSDITSSTYNMLTRVSDWPAFSNHTPGDGGSSSNSLEAIHDGIHVDVGGGGQMSDPSVAGKISSHLSRISLLMPRTAYDPIFYLHHCNVDRMLQLWSALNPGVWVSPNSAESGTFTIPANTQVDENTRKKHDFYVDLRGHSSFFHVLALTPFWNTQSTFWASSATRDTAPLGYTYPDFNGLDTSDPNALQTAIANLVNQMYGSSVFGFQAFARPAAGAASSAKKPAVAPAHAHAPTPVQPALDPIPQPPQAHAHVPALIPAPPQVPIPAPKPVYDWTCRIHFKKYELGASCVVLIFLGDVPNNASEWRVSPNYVGAHYGFVNSSPGECDNCRSQADLLVEGFVHLNSALIPKYGSNLSPEVIKPYLKENLKWRVQKVCCRLISRMCK